METDLGTSRVESDRGNETSKRQRWAEEAGVFLKGHLVLEES